MFRTIKIYTLFFVITLRTFLIRKFQARFKVITYFIADCFYLVLPLITWSIVSKTRQNSASFIPHIIITFFTMNFLSFNHYDDIEQSIVNGKLSLSLISPININKNYIIQYICNKITYSIFIIPVFLVTVVLIRIYNISDSIITINTVTQFIVYLVISSFLSFEMGMLIGSSTFWLGVVWPFRYFFILTGGALAGLWFPFEKGLRWLSWSPFALMGTGGAEIFLTNGRNPNTIIFGVFIWWIITMIISNLLWKVGLKKYEAVGG